MYRVVSHTLFVINLFPSCKRKSYQAVQSVSDQVVVAVDVMANMISNAGQKRGIDQTSVLHAKRTRGSGVATGSRGGTTAAVNKISHIALSEEQQDLKIRILDFVKRSIASKEHDKPDVFLINGDAGTGKSVILNSLFNTIQKLSRTTNDEVLSQTNNYLVVNHPEMLKLYREIAKQFPFIKKADLERPTTLINKYANEGRPIDVLIIDEAHLLSTSKDAFKRFYQENHLEELLRICKVAVLVFDDKQSLRMGSYWGVNSADGASLSYYLSQERVRDFQVHQLKKQFRVVAQDDLLQWINDISTNKKINPLPIKDALIGGFEFKVFESCQAMYDMIKARNAEYGQCRILSTYDFPYRLDGADYFVYSESDEFKLRWDRYLPQITIPWSEREDTIDEVGSVYTIQGFDLNYAGVILGRSLQYDPLTDSIKVKPEFYDDHAGFTRKKNIHNVATVREKIVLNSLNVLLTRGVRGLYIFAFDQALRERLLLGAPSIVAVRK